MPFVPPPEPLPITFLWGMGFRFEKQGYKFYDTYQDIKDVWLLGDYLAWPFYFISTWCLEIRDIAWEGNKTLGKFYLWVDQLISGTLFMDILDFLSYNYQWIRVDPLGFIRENLKLLSVDFSMFIASANSWFIDKLRQHFPELFHLASNVIGWLRDRIQALFPQVFPFLLSPLGTLYTWVVDQFPVIRALTYNPIGYIIARIIDYRPFLADFFNSPLMFIIEQIKSYNSDLTPLLINPKEFILSEISNWFGFKYNPGIPFIYQVINRGLEYLISQSYTSLSNFSSLVCDIIIKFL